MTPNEPKRHVILVVDDDRAITKLLRLALEADGHEVVVAADGQECSTRWPSADPT